MGRKKKKKERTAVSLKTACDETFLVFGETKQNKRKGKEESGRARRIWKNLDKGKGKKKSPAARKKKGKGEKGLTTSRARGKKKR